MNEEQRAHLEKRLQEEREKALDTLRQAEAEESTPQGEAAGDVSRFPTHLADEGSDTEEQERDFIVASQASEVLERIDAALELLYEDPVAYARCERCGEPIEMERLDLIPWTRLCARDAARAEG